MNPDLQIIANHLSLKAFDKGSHVVSLVVVVISF